MVTIDSICATMTIPKKKRKVIWPQSHMMLLVIIALLMIAIVSFASIPKSDRNVAWLKSSLFDLVQEHNLN